MVRDRGQGELERKRRGGERRDREDRKNIEQKQQDPSRVILAPL